MLTKLPKELQDKIIDYAIECKKSQNFYINKEITNYICKKHINCRKVMVFKKDICYGCNKQILKKLKYFFVTI